MHRTRERRSTRAASFLAPVRDFLRVDLAMTRFAFRHLTPAAQSILCAPVLALLAVVDFFISDGVV